MKDMVERFQCPGCVVGADTKCGEYDYSERDLKCVSHVLGTCLGSPRNKIALGLPKGFNKPGFNQDGYSNNKIDVRMWDIGTHPAWDDLNIPVWAMEHDGFLFVRTYAPRINQGWIDVIRVGEFSLCPKAIDVSTFFEKID